MKQIKLIFVLSFMFCLFGCATKKNMGEYFQPSNHLVENNQYARLYFYFPNHGLPTGEKGPSIFANEHEVVQLPNATYTETYVQPGTYRIHTLDRTETFAHLYENHELTATFLPGESYYIAFLTKVTHHSHAYRVGNGTVTPVSISKAYEAELVMLSEAQAYSGISLCHFVKPMKRIVRK